MIKKIVLILAVLFYVGCNLKDDPINIDPKPEVNKIGKTFGGAGDEGASYLKKTTDSGYIITGNKTESGKTSISLLKLNTNFEKIWEKNFEGSKNRHSYYINVTQDGGYIISGSVRTENNGDDLLIIKTDSAGELIWEKNVGGFSREEGHTIYELNDRSIVLIGLTSSKGLGLRDIYLIKMDQNGNLLWDKTFGTENDDTSHDLVITDNNEFIILGTSNQNVYLLKTDSDGNEIWNNSYNNGYEDSGWGIIKADNGFVLGCYTDGKVLIIKTDKDGNKIWEKIYGGYGEDFVLSGIKCKNNSGYIFVGQTNSFGNGGSDAYIIKIDDNGNTVWEKYYGESENDSASSIIEKDNGDLVIVGSTASFGNGGSDTWVFVLNSAGDIIN